MKKSLIALSVSVLFGTPALAAMQQQIGTKAATQAEESQTLAQQCGGHRCRTGGGGGNGGNNPPRSGGGRR